MTITPDNRPSRREKTVFPEGEKRFDIWTAEQLASVDQAKARAAEPVHAAKSKQRRRIYTPVWIGSVGYAPTWIVFCRRRSM
jgi:hypothetical protein